MYEAGGRIVHGKLSRQESEVSQCLRRCRMEQPVTSTAADYRLPAPQFLGRQPMLEINGLTGSHRSAGPPAEAGLRWIEQSVTFCGSRVILRKHTAAVKALSSLVRIPRDQHGS